MSDQVVSTQSAQPAQSSTQQGAEHTIPYSRFAEVNEARRKLEEQLAQIQAAQKAETEKRLAEQNQYKELAETRGADLVKAQAEAAKVAAYEATLAEVLASQVAELPEDKRGLVPEELTTQQKIKWIAKNAAILRAPAAFDIGAGRQGGGGSPRVTLTPEEHDMAVRFGMSDAEYAKSR